MNTDPMIHVTLRQGGARASRRSRLRMKSFGMTDQGRERTSNQDRFLIAPLSAPHCAELPRGVTDRGHLFVIADGMGGANGGERASTLAIAVMQQHLVPALCAPRPLERPRIVEAMRAAVMRADADLLEEAARRPELEGMGTTLTMAYVLGRDLFLAHVGDSRCYALQGGQLRRLTHDHTMVEEMVRFGVLPPERAVNHGLRHLLTNVVGGNATPAEVEVHELEIAPSDVLLLCSDGLTEMVPDDVIGSILGAFSEPMLASEALVARANERGGRDNITAIVARHDVAA
jgi:protein phosphatase